MPKPSATEIRTATSFCALFQSTALVEGYRPALETSDGTLRISWQEYAERVRDVAAGLHALGVRHGDTVGIMLSNRPEFNIVDSAALHLGAVPFSIYNTSSAEQIRYVFGNAENRVVVTEEAFLAEVQLASTATKIEHVVCVSGGHAGTTSLDELVRTGDPAFDFDAAWQQVRPSDVATLIYTSGTTGPPKGVELTHAGLLSNLAALLELADPGPDDRVVSYLPDAHIVNRFMAHYGPMIWGYSVTTVADPKQMVATLPAVRPTLFVAVPMLWYKIKAALEHAISEETGLRGAVAMAAVRRGSARARLSTAGRPVPMMLDLQAVVADRLVLRKLRAKLGLDEVKVALTGAAPIAPEALEFVVGIGLPVCEAWGMSELSALATVNRPDSIRVGTVGLAAPGVEIQVAEDGELLVRGPGVMKGYRGQPELTSEAIDADGWMHTGDIGSVDPDGYVRILDRKKELIINSGGKNMSPSNIENTIKVSCPLIGSVVAIGDNQPFVVALVTLDPDAAAQFAAQHGLEPDPRVLANHPEVRRQVEEGVARGNQRLSRVEQVKYTEILPVFWEPGGDELTPTMKLRRKPIAEKYASQIRALYTNARKV
ncbi:AMP-dependent synthetase/ligase [Nocardioides sp. LML1-1-1.1]|uniref:AMP-dependent synthetase/ligase n=1 Tax=Nocardioides sp. LML1-1-1.1 TaxID=3135248 RepID=UPI00344281AB